MHGGLRTGFWSINNEFYAYGVYVFVEEVCLEF